MMAAEQRRMVNGRYWISPGTRLAIAAVLCLLALVFVVTIIPALSARGLSNQNRVNADARARQGAALLHRFDCTYGRAVRSVLLTAERSARTSARLGLANRQRALARGDKQAANISLQSRRAAQHAAASYQRQRLALSPLGLQFHGIPIPPCTP